MRMNSKLMAKTKMSRRDSARAERLAMIEEQVQAGILVIRQMTPDEREKYGPPKNLPAVRSTRTNV